MFLCYGRAYLRMGSSVFLNAQAVKYKILHYTVDGEPKEFHYE